MFRSGGFRVVLAAARSTLVALGLTLLASPIALASTEGSASAGSSPPTLLIAALGGASLAAVWLLRSPRPSRGRGRDRDTGRTVDHAHKPADGDDR